jgi:hypothetical protein
VTRSTRSGIRKALEEHVSGDLRQLGSPLYLEATEQLRHVELDRVRAEVEGLGDLGVRFPLGDESKNLQITAA